MSEGRRFESLAEFYEAVATLIGGLRAEANAELADKLERALRGGATSGEILTTLGAELDSIRPQTPDISRLLSYVRQALGLDSSR